MKEQHICMHCGGELEYYGVGQLKCKYCDSIYEDSLSNSEEGMRLFSAYELLRKGDIAQAQISFEDILSLNENSYEGHMGLALARNGIVFVVDKRKDSRKRVPTCYAMPTAFSDDKDYKKACLGAPAEIKACYEKMAQDIDKIRNYWNEIVKKQQPFDIFLSYKETDENNKRTKDSEKMQDLYDFLRDAGYKVFYSRVSLSNIAGEEYEPYIYNALRTAKVMIVYAQNSEYYNATWIRNEWVRWQNQLNSGAKHRNSLIVAYDSDKFDAKEIPLSLIENKQAFDMSKFKASENLLNIIKNIMDELKMYQNGNERIELFNVQSVKQTKIKGEKIEKKQFGSQSGVKADKTQAVAGAITIREIGTQEQEETSLDIAKLLKIASEALKKGRFKIATGYYQSALSKGDNAEAHMGLMMSSVNAKDPVEFALKSSKFELFDHFDGLAKNCSQSEMSECANMFLDAIADSFKNGNVQQAIKFYSKIVAYNIEQRAKAMSMVLKEIFGYIEKGNKNLDSLTEVYLATVANDGADRYIEECATIIDKLLEFKRYDSAALINAKIGEIDQKDDIYLFNRIRLEIKSTLSDNNLVDLYSISDIKDIDDLLANSDRKKAKQYNSLFANTLRAGVEHMYKSGQGKIKQKIIDLLKIVISYSYSKFEVNGNKLTESEFKYKIFDAILSLNSKKHIYSYDEIVALKEYLQKTLDENAVDEFVAYEISTGVYMMKINAFDKSDAFFDKALDFIPGDNNIRFLKLVSKYHIKESALQDIRTKRKSTLNFIRADKQNDFTKRNDNVYDESNYIIYALIKAAQKNKFEGFIKELEDIFKYCKQDETEWKSESQCKFYIDNAQEDLYYNLLAEYNVEENETIDFASISRFKIDYKSIFLSQYDYCIKLVTNEIINLIADTDSKNSIAELTDVYYNILKYIKMDNKVFMCERLKYMADLMLIRRKYEQAIQFYTYAIKENALDGELYWRRLHAKYHAINTVELILCKNNIEDDEDFSKLCEVETENIETYMMVQNKQEMLKKNRKYKSLLKKKKDFIPSDKVNDLFICKESEFVDYLKRLEEDEQISQMHKKEKRVEIIAKSGNIGVRIFIYLLTLAFSAFAFAYATIGSIFWGGAMVDSLNSVAMYISTAYFVILQLVYMIKFGQNKKYISIAFTTQIINTALLIVLDAFTVSGIYYFEGTGLVMTILFIIASAGNFLAMNSLIGQSWGVFGNSLTIPVATFAYVGFNLLFVSYMSTTVSVIVFIIFILTLIAMAVMTIKNDLTAWIAFGIFMALLVLLAIVFGISIGIFKRITVATIIVSVIIIAIVLGIIGYFLFNS